MKKTFQVRGGKNIDPSLVTVVVQGYVNKKETGCTIKSVRKYLPGAKIILSTWKNCDVSEIDYDELVLNDDPGAVECGAFPELSILTDDVRKLYSNISLIRQSDMHNYHYKYPDRAMGYKYTWRYTSEQEIFLGVVKQSFPDLKFDDWTDYNEELCLFSKRVIFDNFLILNFFQNKILNLKYPITCFANSGFSYSDKDLMTNEEQIKYCMKK